MIIPDKFLLPEDDGLPVRSSNEYARYKLLAVQTYIEITNTSMKEKPWKDRYYVDLFAGPGKNKIGNSIVLGSPLIALTTQMPFTQYRLNEKSAKLATALKQRVAASPQNAHTEIYEKDANEAVKDICEEITARDLVKDGLWSTLNVAFLDPEGLELHWETVAHLAKIAKMDLIINFSTNGIIRNYGAGNYDVINRFFGTDEWMKIYRREKNPTFRRRALIDFYRGRLREFRYNIIDPDPDLGGEDISFKNIKNAQVYSLIFASKNELGDKFWKAAAKRTRQPRLF